MARRIVVLMQTTLDNRIATGEGAFWEPFCWGEPETRHINEVIRRADTWAMSRVLYEAIVPWWEAVAAGEPPGDAGVLTEADHEFARLQHAMTTIVFSRTLSSGPGPTVLAGDLAAHLADLKQKPGGDVLLSCGPRTLAPLAATPGLIDAYVLAVHPVVVPAGPALFGSLELDLTLETTAATRFGSGVVVLQYRVLSP